METFSTTGSFWLASDTNSKAPGTLIFDPLEGATLEVFGQLGALRAEGPSCRERILGIAGNDGVTLEQCFRTNERISSSAVTQTWRPQAILRGLLVGTEEPLFDGVFVAFDALQEWVGRSGLSREDVLEGDERVGVGYAYRCPATRDAVASTGERVRLSFGWSTAVGGEEVTIREHCSIEVSWRDAPRPLNTVLRQTKALTDLLTIAAARVPGSPTIKLRLHGDEPGRLIEHLARPVGSGVSTKRRLYSHEFLFTLDDLGGVDAVARWITIAERFRRVLGSLNSVRYRPDLYVENRFLNVVHAAETFHRICFPDPAIPDEEYQPVRKKMLAEVPVNMREVIAPRLQYANEPFLGRRLAELVELAGPAATKAVGNGRTWARAIADFRNHLTHTGEEDQAEEADGEFGEAAHFLAESVSLVLVLCFLRECQASESVAEGCLRAPSVQFVVARLPTVMERLALVQRRS